MLKPMVQGFSLIELAVALAVLAVVIVLGLPEFTTWIANTRIRTAAEAIANGIQLARTEAVRQNLNVQFELGGAGGPTEWRVSAIASGGALVPVQQRPAEGSGNVVVGILPAGATMITFNSLGRVVANSDASASIAQVDVCSTAPIPAEEMRRLRILIGTGGSHRMCDPQVAPEDPRGCPAGGASAC